MYKNFRVGGGIVLGLSALVLSLAACTAAIDRNSDNTIKLADETTKTYSYTFNKDDFSASGEIKELNGISWTLGAVDFFGFDNYNLGTDKNKGFQFGSGNKPYKEGVLLTTNYFNDKNISSVTINASGASSINGTLWINNESAIKLTASATNYTFSGLNITGALDIHVKQTTSKAIYIKSIAITYTTLSSDNFTNLTYHYNNETTDNTEKYTVGSSVEKPADPTYAGFRFDGWYTDKALTTAATFPIEVGEADIDLYAKWVKTYTVTFKNDGKTYLTETVDENTCVAKPKDPTKEADSNYEYTFAYWESNYKEFDFNTQITSDITLYAKYSQTRVSAEPVLLTLEANASISFDYTYNLGQTDGIKGTVPNAISTTIDPVTCEGFSYTASVDSVYADNNPNRTKFKTSEQFIEVTFDNPINDLSISFPCTGFSASGSGNSIFTLSLVDKNGNKSDITQDFAVSAAGNTSFASDNNIKLVKDVKSFKLSFAKGKFNVGVGEIALTYSGMGKTYTSFSNTKVQLGYKYTLGEDERIAETGLLVTGVQTYTLPTAGEHFTEFPSATNEKIKKYVNTSKVEDFYININFLNAEGVEEVKGKADLYLYAVPYSKENGKDYYVYGTGIKTSLSDLILGISNESLASAYIEYLTSGE